MFNLISHLRKVDKDLYNNSAESYIPIACHYNENTLLTKNGELLQIIQINGINSEKISTKLFNLRDMVRSAIRKNVVSDNFAFWVHTVRRKTDLDDPTPYSNLLSSHIHDLWKHKNYWDDKFVNTLYISIIYNSPEITLKNFKSLVNSLFFDAIVDFQNQYLSNAFQELNSTVDKILLDLEEFGAIKLGIRFEEENIFSDLMFLYRRIVHLNEEYCLVPITDLSSYLASTQYAVGSDKIEVISAEGKKFAAIISLREYQEVSTASLDSFLQLPLEFIATEIFYFVDQKEVVSAFSHQDYILKISGDANLRAVKGIDKIMNSNNLATNQYCKQQISITIIGEDLATLDQSITKASKELAKIGIVHIREDISLEHAFWAQLPGNSSFLRRMSPTILENTATLASLHNFPTGDQYNVWGRAVTLLRTEKGTPYFMNFYAKNNRGNTCILGTSKTGKTVLTNFLLSEATKYNPTIIYLSNNNDSQIFIEAIEGVWNDTKINLINPFLLPDTQESRQFSLEFIKIICNHHVSPLTEEELKFLTKIIDNIFAVNVDDRNLSSILKTVDFSLEGGELIRVKLNDFMEGGLYHGVFEGPVVTFSEKCIKGFNLYNFSEQSFTERFYPAERKYLEQFTQNLAKHSSITVGLIYAVTYHLTKVGTGPKILVVDSFDTLCKPENYHNIMSVISDCLAQNNGIMVSNFNFSYLQSQKEHILQEWLNLIDTKFILPSDVKLEYLDKILGLNKSEIEKLSKFTMASRMFLINKDGQSIAAELSIAGLIGVVRILSSKEDEFRIYQEVLTEYPGHPDNWINHLYNKLNGT